MAGISWRGLGNMINRINVFKDARQRKLDAIIDRRANEMRAWMKENAPWQDRTGKARRTLDAFRGIHGEDDAVTENISFRGAAEEITTLILKYNVYYGVFLETMQHGRFAIIYPAIQHFAPLIKEDIDRELGS